MFVHRQFSFFGSVRAVCVLIFVLAGLAASAATTGRKFYADDPLAREPENQDASGVREWDINLIYDLGFNLFVTAKKIPANIKAQNVNTIDEVPDSSWFTNRIIGGRLTP